MVELEKRTAKFNGPLRKCASNRRYFTDESGEAIFLTGSHVWTSLQDIMLVGL